MKNKMVLFLILIIINSCSFLKNKKEHPPITKYFVIGGLYSDSFLIESIHTDSLVFYQIGENVILSKSRIFSSFEEEKSDGMKDTVNLVLKKSEEKDSYFMYKKSERLGFYFDSITAPNYIMLPVDSLLKRNLPTVSFGAEAMNTYWKEIVSKKTDEYLEKKYLSTTDTGLVKNDTLLLLFSSKFNNAPYSISKYLDSIIEMHLIEAKYISNKELDSNGKLLQSYSKFGIKIELAKMKQKEMDFIMNLIKTN
jgi:hypothetical protein